MNKKVKGDLQHFCQDGYLTIAEILADDRMFRGAERLDEAPEIFNLPKLVLPFVDLRLDPEMSNWNHMPGICEELYRLGIPFLYEYHHTEEYTTSVRYLPSTDKQELEVYSSMDAKLIQRIRLDIPHLNNRLKQIHATHQLVGGQLGSFPKVNKL